MNTQQKYYSLSDEEAQLCHEIMRERLQKIGFKLMANDGSIKDVANTHKELKLLSSICEKLEQN